ncbi:MAG: DUF302 domain-containing protein [Gammaproteobacteria bacterium]|nr:DUF302 domain-containing protein [Gammaproteobacteria bacterium]
MIIHNNLTAVFLRTFFLKAVMAGITTMILFVSSSVLADHKMLIMGRSYEAFPETMTVLQDEIIKAGYTISIVQRVDIGLTGMGFKTDKYRVVFFGKPEEIKSLPDQYPELAPYLPLAITIFAEDQETILAAMSPQFISHAFLKGPADKELSDIFERWEKDIKLIIENVSDFEY